MISRLMLVRRESIDLNLHYESVIKRKNDQRETKLSCCWKHGLNKRKLRKKTANILQKPNENFLYYSMNINLRKPSYTS